MDFKDLIQARRSVRGYDTLIMGMRDAAAIREILDIPDTEDIMSVIAIGKRGQEPVNNSRKELSEVVKFI